LTGHLIEDPFHFENAQLPLERFVAKIHADVQRLLRLEHEEEEGIPRVDNFHQVGGDSEEEEEEEEEVGGDGDDDDDGDGDN
jgi:hypothetical protein